MVPPALTRRSCSTCDRKPGNRDAQLVDAGLQLGESKLSTVVGDRRDRTSGQCRRLEGGGGSQAGRHPTHRERHPGFDR